MTDGYDSRFAWEDEDANRAAAYDAEDMCTCEMGEMGMVEHLVPGCPLHDLQDGHESS